MRVRINLTIIFLSSFITLALIIVTESAVVEKEGITSTFSFENALAQQNSSSNSAENGDTELGDPELGGDTGMTESDFGGKDIGTTVSDLENDTDITKNNQTG
jgi:hypothetical protein